MKEAHNSCLEEHWAWLKGIGRVVNLLGKIKKVYANTSTSRGDGGTREKRRKYRCRRAGNKLCIQQFYTLSRRPERRLFIPLFAHPHACMRITRKWVEFYLPLRGTARFPNLCKLSKCLLALPVSNAETERVFSMV